MKRTLSIAVALAVTAGLTLTPFGASAAPKPIIEDPLGDANFVNDQGTGDGSFGDFTGADAGTVSDITAITLTNDAKNLTIAIATEVAPPAATAVGFRVRFNPDDAGTHCITVEAFFPGANNNLTEGVAHFHDVCAGTDAVELKMLGTTIVVPRKLNKAFAKGATLTVPQAQSFQYSGTYPVGVAAPTIDTTKVGTDYKVKN